MLICYFLFKMIWLLLIKKSRLNSEFVLELCLRIKVNSVQEAFAKCFAVHILKFEILQIIWKKWNKEHQTLSFQFFINKSTILMLLISFLMWFARFQNSICEPQSIWHKLLILSCLYLRTLSFPSLLKF